MTMEQPMVTTIPATGRRQAGRVVQLADPGPCPRCREELPQGVYWEPLPAPPARHPAYRLRHKRRDGQVCVVWSGPHR